MTHREKCPNCGRYLTEDELYCYFCEIDLSKTRKTKHSGGVFGHEKGK